MVIMAVVIIIKGVMAVVITIMAVVMVMAPGKGSGKNPEKSSPRKKRGIPLRLPIQKGVQVGVIGIPLDTLPAQKE